MKQIIIAVFGILFLAGCVPLGRARFETEKTESTAGIISIDRWLSRGIMEGQQSDMIPKENGTNALYCEEQYVTGAKLFVIRGHLRNSKGRMVYYATINPENRIIILAIADIQLLHGYLESMARNLGAQQGAIWNPDPLRSQVAAQNQIHRAANMVPLLPTAEMLLDQARHSGKQLSIEEAESQIDGMQVGSYGMFPCYKIEVYRIKPEDAGKLKLAAADLGSRHCAAIIDEAVLLAMSGSSVEEKHIKCLEIKKTLEPIAKKVVYGGYTPMGEDNNFLFNRFVRSLAGESHLGSIISTNPGDIGDALAMLDKKLRNPDILATAQNLVEPVDMETEIDYFRLRAPIWKLFGYDHGKVCEILQKYRQVAIDDQTMSYGGVNYFHSVVDKLSDDIFGLHATEVSPDGKHVSARFLYQWKNTGKHGDCAMIEEQLFLNGNLVKQGKISVCK